MFRHLALVPVLALVLVSSTRAQDPMAGPAPELKKLEPLIGNWSGSGKMSEPSGAVTPWQANGSYRWCLDGHFVQEDFAISFEGMAAPFVFRAYLGWDAENKRYVNAMANNSGKAELNEVTLLPDGSILQLMLQRQMGLPYAQRSLFQVTGDTMTHTVDLLMANGASMTIVDGTFRRGGDGHAGALTGPTFMAAKPHGSIARLARSAGVFEVNGEMVMAPGQAPIKITGSDTFTPVFEGTVIHGHTEGVAEGMPGKYVGEVFWAHDEARDCLVGIYVSNFGEVMTMDARWSKDGKLIATSHGLMRGEVSLQRTLMTFDAAGAVSGATSHSIAGTGAPHESFRATYTKKK